MTNQQATISEQDQKLREFWRRVQGPGADINGPLIRFAAMVRRDALAQAQQWMQHKPRCLAVPHYPIAPGACSCGLVEFQRALAASEDQR